MAGDANSTYLSPSVDNLSKGVTIEAKRLLGLPSCIGWKPRYYMILSVDGISKTTNKISQKDGGVKWDQKLSFATKITDSSVFRLELFRTSKIPGKDNHSIGTFETNIAKLISVGMEFELKVEDSGTYLVQIYFLVHRHIDPRTEMKTQVGYTQRIAEGEDLEKHLTTAESVTSIADVSKGGRKTAEMIDAWKPIWSKFDALIKLSEKIAEVSSRIAGFNIGLNV
ncbi:hypothetical protein M422DRAFT_276378 [Sphaerobolus stellatus SS14]|uniref:C2 domain-containing protein n=1 Tax=Sphaerobolus stellatus (strain SS14) TaxID=990650 RepID=A0A0C9UCC9_SPHS4|nr:hypothetical protein M422DRAFT_276378 [Sphaerobolus stellatus SS14]